MRIGDWDSTMEQEKSFWDAWLQHYVDQGQSPSPFYWEAKAWVIKGILLLHNYVISRHTKILEIGPGAIGTINTFEYGDLYACEPLWDQFVEARPTLGPRYDRLRQDIKLLCYKAEDMPLDSGPFDIILALNSLDHCEDPDLVLDNISVVLKQDGYFFEATTVWPAHEDVDAACLADSHPYLYVGNELNVIIESYGLSLIERPFRSAVLDELWAEMLQFTAGSWPCYLRVWRKT